MKVYKLLNLLHGLDGKITLQSPNGPEFTAVKYNWDYDKTVKLITGSRIANDDSSIYLPYNSALSTEDMISIFANMPLDTDIMIEKDFSGGSYEPLLFVDASASRNICLKSRGSMDLTEELQTLFDNAADMFADESAFYEDLLDIGFTVKDVRDFLGNDVADHMETFCKEHAIII